MNMYIEVNDKLRKEHEEFLEKERERQEENALYVDNVIEKIKAEVDDIKTAIQNLGYTPTHRITNNIEDEIAISIVANRFELPNSTTPIRNARFVVWRNRDEGEIAILSGSVIEVDERLKKNDFIKHEAKKLFALEDAGIKDLVKQEYYKSAKVLIG
ncbi:hypothetical protein [Macrococcoides caseolyticum]|uniref:hypothetical protein n=1 Tax=Macrococcoides caseolyticum TaxID=69966 RepID=UPI000C335FB1|nr:hypothetical protein [Macrococcus caseolyticus]PKE17775.1 hypothetical protein CW718_01965 [Macrococcus caseolyticus]